MPAAKFRNHFTQDLCTCTVCHKQSCFTFEKYVFHPPEWNPTEARSAWPCVHVSPEEMIKKKTASFQKQKQKGKISNLWQPESWALCLWSRGAHLSRALLLWRVPIPPAPASWCHHHQVWTQAMPQGSPLCAVWAGLCLLSTGSQGWTFCVVLRGSAFYIGLLVLRWTGGVVVSIIRMMKKREYIILESCAGSRVPA